MNTRDPRTCGLQAIAARSEEREERRESRGEREERRDRRGERDKERERGERGRPRERERREREREERDRDREPALLPWPNKSTAPVPQQMNRQIDGYRPITTPDKKKNMFSRSVIPG